MLFKRQERLICEEIAAGQPPYSQRAQSLLAIDAGATQTAAAQQSGQTVWQVRYWLGKFRKSRMGIFPEEFLPQTELATVVPEKPDNQGVVGEETKGAAADAGAEAEPVKKGKAKAKKKSKTVKATKKTKKNKKSKGGKKRKDKKVKKGSKKKGKKKPSGKKPRKKKSKK